MPENTPKNCAGKAAEKESKTQGARIATKCSVPNTNPNPKTNPDYQDGTFEEEVEV